MATFAEVEDLRDWCEDALGEFLARMQALDGDEPPEVLDKICSRARDVKAAGLGVLAGIEELLIHKKTLLPPP